MTVQLRVAAPQPRSRCRSIDPHSTMTAKTAVMAAPSGAVGDLNNRRSCCARMLCSETGKAEIPRYLLEPERSSIMVNITTRRCNGRELQPVSATYPNYG